MRSPHKKASPFKAIEKDLALKALMLDAASDSIILHDLEGNIILFNEAALKLRGYSRDEFQGLNLADFVSPEDVGLIRSRIAEVVKKGEAAFESAQKRRDGSIIHVESHSKLVTSKGRQLVLSVARNITQRKQAQKALQEILQRQDLVLNSLPVVFYTADISPRTATTWINDQVKDLTGYSPRQFTADDYFWETRLHPDDKERALKEYRKVLTKDSSETEYRWLCADGSYHWFLDHIALIRDEYSQPKEIMGVWVDITGRKHAEEKIQASLREKEVLLKEIHHRVKNNMQIISSLLSLQARELKDKQAVDIFKESQNRIRSMAFVHEKLYQSSKLSKIDFSEYIKSLVPYLFNASGVDASKVSMRIDAEKISLDIETAIPAGLILNELVSNSLKHAFPPGTTGEIRIGLKPADGNRTLLTVADTGRGFPKNLDIRNTESLGMQIVSLLVNQLEARMDVSQDGGTTFKIVFGALKYRQRI